MNGKKVKQLRRVAKQMAKSEIDYNETNLRTKKTNGVTYKTKTKILKVECEKGLLKQLKKRFS